MNKEGIITALKEGAVNFSYTKNDGSTRSAKGTLNPTLVPEAQRASVESIDTSTDSVTYWDMEKEAFRTFNPTTASLEGATS